mmetsp:Transcript_5168/g.6677  ORF Transcript_5168/g.6677 Transcript_5168/m.6677 type:complete len:246 (+) Transcript_5168:122-859(+)
MENILKSIMILLLAVNAHAFQASYSNVSPRRSVLKSTVLEEPAVESSTCDLPPLLQEMATERRNYEMNLGRAMDVLRKDYPYMLHKMPDFSIYNDDISVRDPTGVQLSGLTNYKNSFSFLQTLVKFIYNTKESEVRSRMMYDFARQSIRISWNAVLVPKVVGNRRNAMYVDGISIYKMDSNSGKIIEHTVDKLLINNTPVQPPYSVLSALKDELFYTGQRVPGVPVGVGAMIENLEEESITLIHS